MTKDKVAMECRLLQTHTNTQTQTQTKKFFVLRRAASHHGIVHRSFTQWHIPVHWVFIVVDFLLDLLIPYFGFGFKKFVQEHSDNHLLIYS
jgi:hypothetical protein